MITKYVLGFAFTPDLQKVLLIKKNKPEWQKGKFNGLGGKIEPSDKSIEEAMRREFFEEAAIISPSKLWTRVGLLRGSDWIVYILFCKMDDDVIRGGVSSDEGVTHLYNVDDLPTNTDHITNLNWIINLARDPNAWLGNVYVTGNYYSNKESV